MPRVQARNGRCKAVASPCDVDDITPLFATLPEHLAKPVHMETKAFLVDGDMKLPPK
jgi:hypothetical protein